MTISQGKESGVAVGQYVLSLTDQCVIGVVSAVSAKDATVRLFTEPGLRHSGEHRRPERAPGHEGPG